MRPAFLTALVAVLSSGALGAQAPGRSAGVDIAGPLWGHGIRLVLEPMVWQRFTLELDAWAQRDEASGLTRRRHGIGTELRWYPFTLRAGARQAPVLPFLALGAEVGEQRDRERFCFIDRGDPLLQTDDRTVCDDRGTLAQQVAPRAQAGIRLLPGRMFIDVSGRLAYGGVDPDGTAGRDWRLRGGLALGYTW